MKPVKLFGIVLALLTISLISACSTMRVPEMPALKSKDLSNRIDKNYTNKVDNFLILLDASSSMSNQYKDYSKFFLARNLASHMNNTMPAFDMNGGLRKFGSDFGVKSSLEYGMTSYARADLGAALKAITATQGMTPLGYALAQADGDLASQNGKSAVIVFSDGKDAAGAPIQTAADMKMKYGANLCIYTVVIGDDAVGTAVLQEVAAASGCGFSVNGDSLRSTDAMADFVEAVFINKKKVESDSDNDGVLDSMDKCPGTPAGHIVDRNGCSRDSDNDGVYDQIDKCPNTPLAAPVDADGCPLDSDNDGVIDQQDRCPATPAGIEVDAKGCPVPLKKEVSIDLKVEFDFDKAAIKSTYDKHLQRVANFLEAYPETKATLEGHTDNRGTDEYNMELSKQRADNVRQHLINNFKIAPNRLTTKAFGESQPIASNDTEEGRAMNRRVVATIKTIIIK